MERRPSASRCADKHLHGELAEERMVIRESIARKRFHAVKLQSIDELWMSGENSFRVMQICARILYVSKISVNAVAFGCFEQNLFVTK